MSDERQQYLDEMAEQRGYVLPVHKMLVAHDLEVMKAMNNLSTAVYMRQRRLDPKTKELLFILSMVCLRLPASSIQNHIKLALDLGVSKEEILEAIELALPEAGLPTFQHGLAAWAEVVGAQPYETSTPTYEGGPAA